MPVFAQRPRSCAGSSAGGLLIAVSALLAAAVAAEPSTQIDEHPPTAEVAADDAPEPVYVARTRPDRIGRITAPVYINGQGPFTFVVDTGASRSAIAPRVTERLGLVPDTARPLELRGITGSASVPSIVVDSLAAGDLKVANQRLPVIAPGVFADADGILGVDGFRGMCLWASFAQESIVISRNGCPASAKDWPTARATFRFGGLVTVKARVGGRSVQAVIDTGAERSLGNLALLEALGLQGRAEDPRNAAEVLGATPHRVSGIVVPVPTIYFGSFEISDLAVTFGDLEVFRLWGLEDEPALVLGMDVLGNADGLVIDYRRSRVRVLPAGDDSSLRLNWRALPGRLP